MAGRPISTFEFVGYVNLLTNGAGAVTLNSHAGCTPPVNSTGAGDVSVTFPDVDAAQCICLLEGHTAAGGLAAPTIVHTFDTVKQLLLWDTAGAAVDANISCALFKINPYATSGDGSGTQGRSQQARDICNNTLQFCGGAILTTIAGNPPTVIRNDGCTIAATGAAGVQLITLPEAVSDNQCFCVLWCQSATYLSPTVVHTSDVQKTITLVVSDGVTTTDGTFGAYFFRVPGMGA